MSENERLREIYEYLGDEFNLRGMSSDLWSKLTYLYTTARDAIAAKPETCVWNSREDYTYTRSCDGRHTALMPGSYLDGSDFQTDELCPGCGRKIEVRE